jgi:hypothetical protein
MSQSSSNLLMCESPTRPLAASTQSALHDSTPQLILWYDSSHCHGFSFLRQLERSAESLESALTDLPPKKTSSLDLHKQERSSQADATSIDDMHTVYCHTHSIITSSNARAGEWGQSDRWTGLFCPGLLGNTRLRTHTLLDTTI